MMTDLHYIYTLIEIRLASEILIYVNFLSYFLIIVCMR